MDEESAWRCCVAVLLAAILPAASAAQGWIEPPRIVNGSSVEKTRSEVRVRLEGRVAQVEVSEWFRNEGSRLAEGHYLYPLPGEAVFQGFSLFQGDAELRGEVMAADRAREIYEEIVRRRADPALIELAGHGLLRARVFPIEPGQERKVTLRYTQLLGRAGDALQFVYAGAVRGGGASGTMHDRPPGLRHPETVEATFEVLVENGDDFLEPFSPTHVLEVRREQQRLTVSVREEVVGRFSLFFPFAGEGVGLSVATHRPAGEQGYFMLTLSPGRNVARAEPRDVTVVLDVSGSMSGEKIGQAKAALHGLLGTMASGDRFRLVAFSNAVRMHSSRWATASRAEVDDAREWVDRLVADGGTNIEQALDEAFRLESPTQRLPVVIFLTDGLPSVGEQSPEQLADRAERSAGRARVFAFGVGHDVNTHLLDRLSEAGRGSTEYVEPGENVERTLGLLAAKIQHPVLTDVELGGAPVRFEEIYPVHIPDVFAGEDLVLFGRYRGDGEGRLSVRGRRAGRGVDFATRAAFADETDANDYIPRLWASRKLGHLTRQRWTEGESENLVEEIRTLALRYGLPSPYTSYLVEEPDVVAGRGGRAPGDLVQRHMRRQDAPAPAARSGVTAVRMATDARTLREAVSSAKLEEAEEQLADRLGIDDSESTRVVAGRIFLMDAGVWRDAAHPSAQEIVHVKTFSAAYFKLIRALDEVRQVVRDLAPVLVAGDEISIQVGDGGIDQLSHRDLARMVARFRGSDGAP